MIRKLLVLAVAVAGTAAPARAEPDRSVLENPTVELSSSFFGGPGATPDALALVLGGQSAREAGSLSFGWGLGWIRLWQPGAGGSVVTSHLGNALLSSSYRFALAPRLQLDVGGGVVMGLSHVDPGPERRLERNSLGYGLAMQGLYDAWLWAPGRAGLLLPVRLNDAHRLGRWTGSATLEAAALFTMPSSEENEDDVGHLVQVGAEYAVLPRPWLATGARLHFVWMPQARLWNHQWSAAPFVAVLRGRWRVGADVLMNIDAPYGFLGGGQRIWSGSLHVGAWL